MADDDAARPRPENGGTDDAPGAAAADAEIARLQAEVAAAQDRLLRDRAELENYKKRVARERADALRFGGEALLRDLLPVLDTLERALQHAGSSPEVQPLVRGVELVVQMFVETLKRHGVEVVQAAGSTFDPAHHEAIAHVESEHPPNTVIDEHRRGYRLHDRLLRPAQVTVGKGRVESGRGDD